MHAFVCTMYGREFGEQIWARMHTNPPSPNMLCNACNCCWWLSMFVDSKWLCCWYIYNPRPPSRNSHVSSLSLSFCCCWVCYCNWLQLIWNSHYFDHYYRLRNFWIPLPLFHSFVSQTAREDVSETCLLYPKGYTYPACACARTHTHTSLTNLNVHTHTHLWT